MEFKLGLQSMGSTNPLSIFLAPNLLWILCFSGPIFSQKTPYDESYFSKEVQVWLRYLEGKDSGPFVGVLVDKSEQKQILGSRNGDSFVFQIDNRNWNAFLRRRGTKCRLTLELIEPVKNNRLSLVASFC